MHGQICYRKGMQLQMNHKGTCTLETKRLKLRRFTIEDAKNIYDNWACDPQVTRFLRWEAHKDVEESRAFIGKTIAGYSDSASYQWAIELKEQDTVIGAIGLMVENENDEKGEIGYCMGKAFWGMGIMAEALSRVLEFAFEEVGFNRIEASHSVRNPASGRVMQKAGMLFECHARQLYKSRSGFEDCDIYYILKEDYFAGRGS
jgi:ribosomal-protein-alanine N-acetyltransferase